MNKARLSKKRVVLRRAAKRRARYEGAEASLVSGEPPAYLRWQGATGEKPSARLTADAEEGNLVKA